MAFGACTFNPGPAGSATGSGAGTGTSGSGASSGHGGFTGITGSSGGSEFGGTDASCGQVNAPTQNLPGEVLIIQDKSGSMADNFQDQMGCTGTMCKWPTMVTAMSNVVMNTQANILWGLKFFANNNTCAVNAGAAIAPALNNAAAIIAAYNATNPGGNTPTRFAVNSGVAYLQTLTDTNPKYILLATDGEPNCNGGNGTPDDANAIAAVGAAAAAGFPVFVVGIGNVATAVQTLNSMATMGGKAQPADAMGRVYYPADDAAGLDAALAAISGQIKSCIFQLGGTPPDPTNIAVLGDGKEIPKDPTNGWSYTSTMMTAVQLNGTACTNVTNGTTQVVSAIFGCPNTKIIIP